MTVPLWAWLAFASVVLAMLILDLFVLHRRATEASLREAATWSGVWITAGLAFGGFLWLWRGSDTGQAYLAGYLIEKTLSVDNVFIYALIFSMFAIPARYQHRVLMLGIVGAMVLRAAFITGGAALLDNFHVAIYAFGVLLLCTAVKVLRGGAHAASQAPPLSRLIGRLLPVTTQPSGQRFLVRANARWLITPLLAALIAIEVTDVVFAVDSIPAIFAVTTDTFVVLTSNVFALLGMRALYFLLAGAATRLRYLQPGLGVILLGVAAKMLLADVWAIPVWASLAFTATVLLTVVIASRLAPGPPPSRPTAAPAGPPEKNERNRSFASGVLEDVGHHRGSRISWCHCVHRGPIVKKEQPVLSSQPSHQDPGQRPHQRPASRRRMAVGAAIALIAAAATSTALAMPGTGSHQRDAAASRRHVTRATLVRSATGTAAAPAGPVTPTTAPLRAGQQGTRQDVPWSQVGPGWMLATQTPARSGSATTLFLIDPAGGRYSMDTLPANSSQPDMLLAWSGDGQRALLEGDRPFSQMEVLNLRTGTGAKFSLGSEVSAFGFTRPDGTAILASTDATRPRLERFSLTGALEQVYPSSFTGHGYFNGNSAVYSPDGTELAVSTSGAMELMSNEGKAIRALPVSPSAQSCLPVRWWTTTDLLAMCTPPHSGVSQLWLVPASGARPTALTASPASRGDLGDLDAWPLPSGTYVQDAGACGYTYLAKLQPNRQTTPVKVAGVPQGDSVIGLGSYAGRLAIQARTPCGPGSSVLWYSPASGTTTPLLGGTAPGGGSVDSAFLYGDPASGL
jgi:tellurite resistance protein TerC